MPRREGNPISFVEIRFPTNISYGSKGGPGFSTSIIVTDGGAEERVARWAGAKHQYDGRFEIRSPEDLAAVKSFYLAVGGALQGFRYKDWNDFNSTVYGHRVPADAADNTTAIDVQIGSADGTKTNFQLIKRYSSGAGSYIRNITKPVDGSVKVALNSVVQSSGWSVDVTTGIVAFVSAPGSGVAVQAGFEFDVPVRFGAEADKVLMSSQDDYGYGSLDPIPLVELNSGLAVDADAYCGGAVEICLAANWQLSASYARGYSFEPQSSGLVVFLPDTAGLPTGGPLFWILNSGPDSIVVKTFSGGAFVTLTSGQGCDVLLTVDGSGNRVWYAV